MIFHSYVSLPEGTDYHYILGKMICETIFTAGHVENLRDHLGPSSVTIGLTWNPLGGSIPNYQTYVTKRITQKKYGVI